MRKRISWKIALSCGLGIYLAAVAWHMTMKAVDLVNIWMAPPAVVECHNGDGCA